MHACFQAELLVGGFDELSSGVGTSSASAPGDIDEGGAQFTHALDTGIQVCNTLGWQLDRCQSAIVRGLLAAWIADCRLQQLTGLGREVLEGEVRLPRCLLVLDAL